MEQLGWGLALSLLSTGFNGALAWVMFRAAREHRSMALLGDARHLLTDVWTSAGVVVGLAAAHWTGWAWLDALVAIGVALNILWQGGQLVWQSSQGLMDEALDPLTRTVIDDVLTRFTSEHPLLEFDNLVTRKAGERSFIDVHMHVPGKWTVHQAATLRGEVEAALLKAVPGVYARIELLPRGMATEIELLHENDAPQEVQGG